MKSYLLLTLYACTSTSEVTADPPAADASAADASAAEEPAERTNTLLTGERVGDFGFAGDYTLTHDGTYHTVELAPGVNGTSHDGKTLCQIWLTSADYKTASGLGVGSKIGDFGTPGVDLFIEPATGMVHSKRENLTLQPDKRLDDGPDATIDPEALVTDIRLGGCGE